MDNKLIIKRSDGGESCVIFDRYDLYIDSLLASKRVIIITDVDVYSYYSSFIDKYENIVIGIGEQIKTLDTASYIYDKLVELGADRGVFLLGFGGGIVTDITGFIASTYMRGVEFGFVATTLLSQVDASVGGKNGVNFEGYKNMIGVFNQPSFVICDAELLRTLPIREFRSGLAEIIKAALITDISLFEEFENHTFDQIYNYTTLISRLIKRSVEIKAHIVELDEREGSERKKLNLGHTFAHAIEKLSHDYNHGEAVALGLMLIGAYSLEQGRLSEQELGRIRSVLIGVGLPVECDIPYDKMCEALKKDKKRDKDSVSLILYNSLGSVDIVKTKFEDLESQIIF